MKKLLLLFTVSLFTHRVTAQGDDVILAYIEKFKDIAIAEMKRTGVPAAITIAQGIHETSAGTSVLVMKSNNHFGIKCKPEWTGASVSHDDDAPQECFRKYDDPVDSYKDHSDFLRNRPYYASLFKLDPTDYKGWAYGLKKAGYATNPRYPQILIKLIEEWDLQEFTYIALGKADDYYKDHPYLVKQDQDKSKVASMEAINPPVLTNGMPTTIRADQKKLNSPSANIVASVQRLFDKPAKKDSTTISNNVISYPEGEFQINRTKVIYAKAGTSLLSIAEQYKMPLAWLVEFNDLEDENVLAEDQLVFLQRKRKISDAAFHIVAEGEDLYLISQKEGIRLESLLEMNLLNDERMQPAAGEKLYLNAKAPERPLLASEIKKAAEENKIAAVDNNAIKHTVQQKEGVYGIARKYGVTVQQIKAWNNLQDLNLKPGQELIINK